MNSEDDKYEICLTESEMTALKTLLYNTVSSSDEGLESLKARIEEGDWEELDDDEEDDDE